MDRPSTRTPTRELGNGKYKILRRLAFGGMAEILLAEAGSIHGFRKKVVIKRILPQYADDQNYIDMFLDEARLAARLNHPSIVQVFDIGDDPEGVFFTMEYVEGHDLAKILGACRKQGRTLSLEEILAILMPAAEALHHAHELRDDKGKLCNLIHRDVSPSNILVTREGRVKVLDFGVAKSTEQQRETSGISLKGKFGYMAPEQCQGLKLDRRCDVFSFGIVLWELCTGRRLFPGGNDPGVLLKIINEDVSPPSSGRPALPRELDEICLKALARDRDDRYSSLKEVIIDLDAFAKSSGSMTNSRVLSGALCPFLSGGCDESSVLPVELPPREDCSDARTRILEDTIVDPHSDWKPADESATEQEEVPASGNDYDRATAVRSNYEVGLDVPANRGRFLWLAIGAALLVGLFAMLRGSGSPQTPTPQQDVENVVATNVVEEDVVEEDVAEEEVVKEDAPAKVVREQRVKANVTADRTSRMSTDPSTDGRRTTKRYPSPSLVMERLSIPRKDRPHASDSKETKVNEVGREHPSDNGAREESKEDQEQPSQATPQRLPQPAVVTPTTVSQAAIERSRIAGKRAIHPPTLVAMKIAASGKRSVGVVKMCLDRAGKVETLRILKSTGHPTYDAKIRRTMKKWQFRPTKLGAETVPVCSAVTFVYTAE